MQLAYPQNDTRAETLRYLGAGGWQPDAASQVLLQKAEDALRAAATPRGVWKQLSLTALPLQNAGNDIARHLRGCDAMVLMAVTLGSGADTLMRRLELTDIALAAVVDAMASAVMEELCNALEAEIRTSVQTQGHYLTGRFSPGYGDCPLTLQQPFAIALDTVRGWRKLPVFAVGLLCAWQCFYLVTVEQHPAWMFTSASRNVAMTLAAVLAVLTVWWAVRSIRRGETC